MSTYYIHFHDNMKISPLITHLCLASHKKDNGKLCRPRSEAVECGVLGPVVQSIVSLTRSLMTNSLTIVATCKVFSNILIFLQKLLTAFAMQKLLTCFSKNYQCI